MDIVPREYYHIAIFHYLVACRAFSYDERIYLRDILAVRLRLTTRRFFCRTTDCPRQPAS